MNSWTYIGRKFRPMETPTLQEFYDSEYGTFSHFFQSLKRNPPVIEIKLPDDKWFFEAPLVYNPRWDKCFWLTNLRYGGNGNKLKAYIEDVYTHKGYWVEAKQLRFVEEIKE